MKTTTSLSEGVHQRASAVERLCSALEAGAGGIDEAFDALFSRFLGATGLRFHLKPAVSFLANVIRQLLEQLLERETVHSGALAEVAEAQARRDRAVQPVRKKIQFFRAVSLPFLSSVVPEGDTSRTPSKLLEQARGIRERLAECPLEDPPDLPAGLALSPTLRTDFDAAVAELEAALADLAARRRWASETRAARNEGTDELDLYLQLGRNVLRVVEALPGCARPRSGGESQDDTPTWNEKGGSHGQPWS